MVMLSDIFPTGFEIGVIKGAVKPGDKVLIDGAGPVGLAALITAQLYSPAEIWMVDLDPARLEIAKKWGASRTFLGSEKDLAGKILGLTGGDGVDVAIEAVGVPATFELCTQVVKPGGHIANVGVHGTKVDLHLERLWSHNITITTRLVDTVSTPQLLKAVMARRLEPAALVTHRFRLEDMEQAYDTFGRAADTHAVKVVVEV